MRIPFFLLPDDFKKRLIESSQAEAASRLTTCEDWNPKMPWKKELNLKAESYSVLNLFPDLKPNSSSPDPNKAKPGEYSDSPSGEWRYIVNTLPTGRKLSTWNGSKIGSVIFDGPVQIPAIYGKAGNGNRYEPDPWMSLSPAELMSMRGGLRLAKGHTVVAGLGLGHLLIGVTKKPSVKKVTLIEISQDLVDWLFPRIKPHLGMDVEIVVADANAAISGLEADVALIDIYETYGNKEFYAPHAHIKKVWVWGSAKYLGGQDHW